jgi:hypothetical protein
MLNRPCVQISQFSTCIQAKMIKSFSEQNGGYRTRRERLLVTVCNLTPVSG